MQPKSHSLNSWEYSIPSVQKHKRRGAIPSTLSHRQAFGVSSFVPTSDRVE